MTDKERELFMLADSLPDAYTDYARCVVQMAKVNNVVDEMICFIRSTPDARTDTVLRCFDSIVPPQEIFFSKMKHNEAEQSRGLLGIK